MSAYNIDDTNTLYADTFETLAGCFDYAETLSSNVTIVLQAGTTYTLASAVAWASETHGLTVIGNGATVHCPNALGEFAFNFELCAGRYIFENIIFTGTDEEEACLRCFFLEGSGKYIFRDCEFSGFGIGGVFCNNNTAELLLVENCKFYELGNTRNGGSDNGIGIAPAHCKYVIIRDCDFHTIGTNNNHHGVYGWNGPTGDVGIWTVDGCRFGDDMFSNIFTLHGDGEIGTLIIRGCETNSQLTLNATDLIFTSNHVDPSGMVLNLGTLTMTGNYFGGAGTAAAIQINTLSGGGVIENNIFNDFTDCLQKSTTGAMANVSISNNVFLSTTRGILINAASGFVLTNCVFRNNTIEATSNCYYFAADTLNCMISGTHRIGTGSEFLRLDATNTELHFFNNDGAGSISFSGATLTNCLIESPYDNITPALTLFSFTANDATPSVAVGSYFVESYTNPTDVTAFDDAVDGKTWTVECQSGNVTLRFDTGSLIGEGGASYATTAGDVLFCQKVGSSTAITIAKA